MEATQRAEGHSFATVHVGSQGVTCLASIKHMALISMYEASVSVLTILVFPVRLVGQKFLRLPTQSRLQLPLRPLLSPVILILIIVVPVRAAESEESEGDMFQPGVEFRQSQRKSWPNGFGDTTVINDMVMMLPQPIEATSSWLILVSLMVCELAATLTSFWTACTVKSMLRKLPRGGANSTPNDDNDLAAMTMTISPTASPKTSLPGSRRNLGRKRERESGVETVLSGGDRRDPRRAGGSGGHLGQWS